IAGRGARGRVAGEAVLPSLGGLEAEAARDTARPLVKERRVRAVVAVLVAPYPELVQADARAAPGTHRIVACRLAPTPAVGAVTRQRAVRAGRAHEHHGGDQCPSGSHAARD